jgi:hypothetical protein
MPVFDNEFKALVLETLSVLLDTVEEEVGDLKDKLDSKIEEIKSEEVPTQLPARGGSEL